MEMQRRKRKIAKAVVTWVLVFCLGITSASFADHGDNPEDVRLYEIGRASCRERVS